MSKMTFVVNFPDGQEPAVSAGTDILGGQLISVAFSDLNERWAWRDATQEPPYHTPLLVQLTDGAIIISSCSEHSGWYDDDDDVHIAGWMPLPEYMEGLDDEQF
ncbi:hypothetical protein NG99_04715 [Erwinia typographi]|uniref:DUF551 domain-containing protein n=1 Tax=Erwinia typographi TaxID=371042 RepID=A0A0A3ZBY8_9GAMM|nr:hypothetical protein [Erwinia typographi]KGT95324.1 hypothetical protein NG99_04715 [Erwinia typographi]